MEIKEILFLFLYVAGDLFQVLGRIRAGYQHLDYSWAMGVSMHWCLVYAAPMILKD